MKNKYSQTREELLLKLINRKDKQAMAGIGSCSYNHDVNGGCAIGCDIRPTLAKKLGEKPVIEVFSLLPNRLQRMGKGFLMQVQVIHDNERYWLDKQENGMWWNELGRSRINYTIQRYSLNLEKI